MSEGGIFSRLVVTLTAEALGAWGMAYALGLPVFRTIAGTWGVLLLLSLAAKYVRGGGR